MQHISVHLFCILWLYWIYVSVILAFMWSLSGVWYKVPCNLQRVKVLLPHYQFGCLWYLFVVWKLWLGLPVLCSIKVVRVYILVLYLSLGERLSVFPHWGRYWLWFFHIWPLLCWSMFPVNLLCWIFIMSGCCSLSKLSVCLLK